MATEKLETDTQTNFAAIDNKPHGATHDGCDLEWLPVEQLIGLYNRLSPRSKHAIWPPNENSLSPEEEALHDWLNERLDEVTGDEYEYDWYTHQLVPTQTTNKELAP